jgi:hypothetical protein
MQMKHQKLIYLDPEEKEGLENILKEIEANGGQISMIRLIRDSIRVFIEYYANQAIFKYSPIYSQKDELSNEE